MKKTILFILCAVLAMFAIYSCDNGHKKVPPPIVKPPDNPDPPKPYAEKEKMLWIDADENYPSNLSTPEKVRATLDRIKDTGFNKIVVDVRPCEGSVLYESEFMPAFMDSDTRDYEGKKYLQFILDEAKARNIKVTVSTVVFGVGFMQDANRESLGVAWNDTKLANLACMQYRPGKGMISAMNDTQKSKNDADNGAGGFIFLNPVHPDSQEYALDFITEIVTKYDFDGYALDYCRFPDDESDFSDFTRGEFDKFLQGRNLSVTTNWPGDVFTYATTDPKSPHVPGKYYKEWWLFRAGIVHDFIELAGNTIRRIKPDVKLEYWAGSWLSMGSGQNWASSSYNLLSDTDAWYSSWMSPEYNTTGFADLLDTFLLGTYTANTYIGRTSPDGKYQDPMSDIESDGKTSLEYGIVRAKRYIGSACAIYGNVVGTNTPAQVEEQIYYCLMNSAGVMVFDMCHFFNNTASWQGFKRGIARAEKEMQEAAEGSE